MNDIKCTKVDRKAMAVLKVCGVKTLAVHEKQLLCPADRCGQLFPSILLLKSHFLYSHNRKPFVCNEANCTWAFPNISKLERHKLTHQNQDNKPFKCELTGCGKSFSTRSNLKHHHKTYHEEMHKFLCSVENCGAAFHNQRSLDIHSNEHGENAPSYRCTAEGCNSRFCSMIALNFHARRHIYKEEELCCKECGKKYTSPSRLKTHMAVHSLEKPFPCLVPECDWSFDRKSRLNRHMDSHRCDRKHRCTFPDCGKFFLRREHLLDHEIVHTRPRKVPKTKLKQSPARSTTFCDVAPKPGVVASQATKKSGMFGSARTSITYSDIVVEKETRNSVAAPTDLLPVARANESICDTNPSIVPETLHSFDTLPSVVTFCDPAHFSVQDDLLSQVLHLDSSTGLSDLEPSTVNLRDLE